MKTQQKTKPSRKQIFAYSFVALCFVLTSVAGRMLVYDEQKNDLGMTDKDIQVAVANQEAAETSSVVDSQGEKIANNLRELSSQGNSSQAVEDAKAALSKPGLSEDSRKQVLSELYALCITSNDVVCFDFVIDQSDKSDPAYSTWLYWGAVGAARVSNNTELVKDFAQSALDLANSNGGESFIQQINNGAESPFTYQELVDAAN
jgi:hypothetical protein